MSETKVIRILIVDDHAMVRSGIAEFVTAFDWMEVTGVAQNGAEAVEFCANNEVDVVLMDMVMPVMDGSEATKRILALGKPITVIAVTSFHEENLVEKALQAGATSYLLKNIGSAELANAIFDAHGGRSTLSPEATKALVDATRNRPGVGFDLTDRELETLSLLVKGLTNAEISEGLSISMPTVKFHLTNLFSKLGAKNRVEAATIALEHRLVDAPHQR